MNAAEITSAATAEEWLLSRELFGMRFGLDRMRRLLTVLGSPQERFRAIHVVGTNGKSSTVRMAAAILEQHGVRAGAYLSPHLVSFRERVRVADADLGEAELCRAIAEVARAAEKVDRTLEAGDRVTQFEALTAAAYAEFARQGVEVAVVEAGLGGRWDATNVIGAEVVVLTNVGLEHTRWLGPTVRDIAREKLAVVREGATLILGADLEPDAREEAAATPAGRVVEAPAEPRTPLLSLAARGAFQRRNFAVAETAAEALLTAQEPRTSVTAPPRGYSATFAGSAVVAAAASVLVPGRFQTVGERPLTIVDGAHNPGGMRALAESLAELPRPRVAVVSVLDDKDAGAMLAALLPLCDALVCTSNANPRALSPATLGSLAAQLGGPEAVVEADPHAALVRARELAGPAGVVLATGSIYLVADLLRPAGETARRSTL